MAYLGIKPFKARLDKGVDYVTNEEKTKMKEAVLETLYEYDTNIDKTNHFGDKLITGINCDFEKAASEFIEIQRMYGKDDDLISAHHGWQSFHKDEIKDPLLVHKIGVDFAQKYFGDRFQVVVSTHLDREHLHNHFFINAVSFKDGKKYHGNKKTLAEARRLSDEICKKYGLNIIEKERREFNEKRDSKVKLNGSNTWREGIKEDLRKSIIGAKTIDDFYSNLEKKGYILKFGKHFAVSPPGYYKNDKRAFIRLKSLNDYRYTLSYIEDSIRERRLYEYIEIKRTYRKRFTKRKLSPIEKKYFHFLYTLCLIRKSQYPSARKMRYYNSLSKRMTKQIKYIKENNLKYQSDVLNKRDELKEKENELLKCRRKLYRADEWGKDEKLKELNNELKSVRAELKILEQIKVIEGKREINVDNKKKNEQNKQIAPNIKKLKGDI